MMLITPVVSAFGHCSGMGMSAYLSESQSLTATSLINDVNSLTHQTILNLQNNQADMDCNTSSDCAGHICGGYGVTSATPVVKTVISSYYSNYLYISPYNTILSTGFRPPRSIL
ncbi:MAG: hypothetical protein KAT04_13805 [Methylococcales bacterium]|nr:hypothetical protein [Methylococcales bacterium]